MNGVRNILCIAPHCDDIEFSCGASVAKFTEEKYNVTMAVFSFCEDSIPENLNKDILKIEFSKAMEHLKIPESNIVKFNYPVRKFPKYRQDILENLVSLRKTISPDLVLMPNSQDVHQDHNTIHHEVLRAFKKTKMIGYEMPWNNLNSINNFHIEVKDRHLDAKIFSILEYKSQLFRGLSDKELFFGLARVRGSQVGVKYAESFELIRWII